MAAKPVHVFPQESYTKGAIALGDLTRVFKVLPQVVWSHDKQVELAVLG